MSRAWIACLSLSLAFACGALRAQTAPVAIHVNLARSLGPMEPAYAWFGYDEANYTTMPYGQALLAQLHDMTPAPVHVRVHNLLTSGTGHAELKFSSTNVYTEDAQGRPVYNFTLLDRIFDSFRDAGITPVVELGFMPKDLAAALPGPQRPYEVHFPGDVTQGASNNPPKDYVKWGALVRAVTAHLAARYGRDTVAQWYFEVWNEPDISYWHGTPHDYFRLYDYAVAGVRSALPTARVGGPASTSPRSAHAYAFLQAFLDHVAHDRSAATGGAVPLDFISFHAKGQPTFRNGVVTMGLRSELIDADRGFSLVAGYPQFRDVPILLSEADPEGCAACSARTNPANGYRNGTLYPAYTAAAYSALLALAAKDHVHLLGMLSWSFEYESGDYFEGYRTLATRGIDKPILNYFRMLGLMGSGRVALASTAATPLASLTGNGTGAVPDIDGMATAGLGNAAVLVWNYSDTPDPAGKPAQTIVTVDGLPCGTCRVLVQQYRIDHDHSNAWTVWQAMGSPQQPTPAQYAALQQAGQLQLLGSPVWLTASNGRLEIPLMLPGESVSLLRLRWQPL